MQNKSIDPIDIKIAAKEGQLKAYVSKGHIYIKDTTTQETVIIGGIGEAAGNKTYKERLELANCHIADLIYTMVDYMKGYVGQSNCPYQFRLTGADRIQKPDKCGSLCCEICKDSFWTALTSNLLSEHIDKNVQSEKNPPKLLSSDGE